VGDSLSDDGGDGESAVDPLPGSVNLPLLIFCPSEEEDEVVDDDDDEEDIGGGGELLRASSAL